MSSATQQDSAAASSTPSASEGRKVSFQRTSTNASANRSSSSAYLSSATTGAGTSFTSQQAYSAYSGVTRRHSLFGTEDRIVLDIGSRYSKFGFSGEPRPRAIVPSVSFSQPSTSYLRLDTSSSTSDPYSVGDTLWDLDFEQCPDDQLRRGKRALVLAQLTQLLRTAFTQHLMVDPKQRKVIIAENPMLPTSIKEMICKVLFNNLQVPSVSFVPAPLLSLLAVGRITGLVLEVGFLESTLMPVYYGRPLTSYTMASARAGKRLNARLKRLLLQYGKFVAAQTSLQDSAKPLKERTHPIDPAMLTYDRLEQIKAKALFVGPYDPNLHGLEELFSVLESEPSDSHAVSDEAKAEAAQSIRQKYTSTSTATPFTFAVSPNSIDPHGTASLIQSVSAPASTSASAFTSGSAKIFTSGVIAIPGWVRERAAELLFEVGDDDEGDPGLIEMTVSAIAKLPIDLRRVMCESILVSGGTAMLPGFANRFRTQLVVAVKKAELPGGALSIERHARRLKGAREGEENKAQENLGLGLHRSVAVLNDPWPDLSQSQLVGSNKAKKGGSEGGSAPAFAANLLAWMGASLAGALKTTSLNAISREAYDEASKSVEDNADATHQGAKRETGAGEEAKDRSSTGPGGEKAPSSRPTMMGASKRGSFVGVVGGLETGAFGGLAAVSRHLMGVPGNAGSGNQGTGSSGAETVSSPTKATADTGHK
ncbi:related to ACT1 - Actin [Ustilago trichophora]|uniref:Related to ACT1 - Actin n=1 Tax=Ustilago trichophora TaxID=86804 RepID=A0A5C3E3H7_9BASI|nr:related to ACT1 - Actin [Ustilago trichophora]